MPQIRASSRTLVLFCAATYLLVVGLLLLGVVERNQGHFVYALDDPYIHLALAENLAHGHYGINPTELSSPSSSVLWPVLLIPFAGTAAHVYVPLAWNLVFGVIAAGLIGYMVSRWPPQPDEGGQMPFWQQMIAAILLLVAGNLFSLTVVGMEHVLQVLVAICCAIGMIEALNGRAIPRWCLAAAVLGPMVRYEEVGLTAAVCLALGGMREWKKAAAVLALGVAPLVGFSGFLMAKGLPALPMSVLVKGNAYSKLGPVAKVFKQVRSSIFLDLTDPERFTMVVLFLTVCGLAWTAESRVRRWVFLGAALAGGAQLTIGRFGWFYRYEVYAVIFLTLICVGVLAERRRTLFGIFALALLYCGAPFLFATEQTVAASAEVYRQQYQMRRFVTEFYRGDYAVNDLGLVSFERRPGAYVLDVFGLASVEASRQTTKTAAWLEEIVSRHGVRLAMLYPEWFNIPPGWTPVAKMCVPRMTISIGGPCVVFYSTTEEGTGAIREELTRFRATLPPDVVFSFDPPRREGGFLIPQGPAAAAVR